MGEPATCRVDRCRQAQSRQGQGGVGGWHLPVSASTRNWIPNPGWEKLPFSNSRLCTMSNQNAKATARVKKGGGGILALLMTITSEIGTPSQYQQAFLMEAFPQGY